MQQIKSDECKVFLASNLKENLLSLIETYPAEKIFLLSDEGAYSKCYPQIESIDKISADRTVIIKDSDLNKTLETCAQAWEFLSKNGADRKSLLINLGGGMPCDLGGFVASTFKRGIDFINIPTTLLAQVDASVGGKTGFNFAGLKNEIGVFNHAAAVLVASDFLETLDQPNMISGFAEMIKHTLIHTEESWQEIKNFDIKNPNYSELQRLVGESIQIKENFVQADPKEQGIRKALNLGHTIGHAFESFALYNDRPILHGYAVAFGMVAELFLSVKKCGLSEDTLNDAKAFIESIYGKFSFTKENYEELFRLVTHDKKNENNRINFSLISAPGDVKINIHCDKNDVFEAFDYYLSH